MERDHLEDQGVDRGMDALSDIGLCWLLKRGRPHALRNVTDRAMRPA